MYYATHIYHYLNKNVIHTENRRNKRKSFIRKKREREIIFYTTWKFIHKFDTASLLKLKCIQK